MKTNEIRKFKLDKKRKKACKLPEDQISIRKTADSNDLTFEVVKYEKDAYITCSPGYINYITADGITRECGIGTFLMKLCLNEEKIHNVANNNENEAVKSIDALVDLCKEDELCNEKYIQNKIIMLEKWISSDCSKIISLHMTADPKNRGHLYMKSSLDTGFTKMFIKIVQENLDWDLYPRDDCHSVEVLNERYNDDGEMVEGDNKVEVFDQDWFFCLPKSPATQPKCK